MLDLAEHERTAACQWRGRVVLRQRVVVRENALDSQCIEAPILLCSQRGLEEGLLPIAVAEPKERAIVDWGESLETQS